MQFFKEQERSRKETTKLVIIYIIAVIGILLCINTLILFSLGATHSTYSNTILHTYKYRTFIVITSISLLIMFLGYIKYTSKLTNGGQSVAEMIGATKIKKNTKNLYERRFLNVLAEVSLAANMPCPTPYVMEDDSINAFAAGFTPNDSVVSITRGALTRLTRDELQGVVAHEVGHLINGDSRLNMRLIGLLGSFMGIALIGSWIADSSYSTTRYSKENNLSGLPIILGLGLWILGYVGIIIGKMLKSAISVEREFYADARAVQYTRNPDGLGGALRKIAGFTSNIRHHNKEIIAHMFLDGDNTSFIDGWFPTHPPISERIEAIYGKKMTALKALAINEDALLIENGTTLIQGLTGKTIENKTLIKNKIPDFEFLPKTLKIEELLLDTEWVISILVALVSLNNSNVKDELIFSNTENIWTKSNMIKPELQKLSLHEQLVLINKVSPLIRELDTKIKEQLLLSIHQIIYIDKKCNLQEFLFSTLITLRLNSNIINKLNLSIDTTVAPLVAKFAELSEDNNAELHYNEAMCYLELSNKISYVHTTDYSGMQQLVYKLRALKPLEKERLLQALKSSASTIQGLDQNSAAMLNVLATVLDVPWAIFKNTSEI